MPDLSPQLADALTRIPPHRGDAPPDPKSVRQLVQLGLAEERAGALGLTQKGAVTKVLRRALQRTPRDNPR